jgi:hypothetical protein
MVSIQYCDSRTAAADDLLLGVIVLVLGLASAGASESVGAGYRR